MAFNYVESQRKSFEQVAVEAIGSTLGSLCIGILIGMTGAGGVEFAGIKLLNWVTTGVGLSTSAARGKESLDAYERTSGRYLSDLHNLAALALLGDQAYIMQCPNGNILFGIHRDILTNAIYTYGFLNSDIGRSYGLTKSELETLIYNGPYLDDKDSLEYEIYEAYNNYQANVNDHLKYAEKLQDALDISSTIDKNSLEDCTAEELQQLAKDVTQNGGN